MHTFEHFPFRLLKLPATETPIWCGNNPTFHRGWDYGICVSDQALYLYSPFWRWFARWHRYALNGIKQASFKDSCWMPMLVLEREVDRVTFRTPFDIYQDEMDFDRKNLVRTVELLAEFGVETTCFRRRTSKR